MYLSSFIASSRLPLPYESLATLYLAKNQLSVSGCSLDAKRRYWLKGILKSDSP